MSVVQIFHAVFYMVLAFFAPVQRSSAQEPAFQRVIPVSMPQKLIFAGEEVPLQEQEIKERLERELIGNSYKQSSMLMILKREGRWREKIQAILKEEGVPEDFFYLAVAESDLDIYALSPRGALGLWQFMKPTAGEFDLEVSDYVDQRRDPVASTRAACKYLKKAYEKFGNWTLVAASYNRGMSGTDRAVKGQKVSSYYDLYMNQETYRYIFRILALKLIIESPDKYGYFLQPQDKYPPLKSRTVEVTETISNLADYAQQQKINYKVLKIYNPWLDSDDYTLPVMKGKSYKIELPEEVKQ